MSTPIPELIATELITRLQTITTGNGFSFSVTSVDRVSRDAKGWTPRNLAIGVTSPIETRNQIQDHEGNPAAIAYRLQFNLHLFVRQSETATDPDQKTENTFVASVKKAVAGTSDWHTFGGNAFDADWGTRQTFLSSEGANAGATLSLLVDYRVSETDPFTARV